MDKAAVANRGGASSGTQRNIRIGDVLCELGYVTEAQIQQALTYQKEHGVRLGDALIALGCITEKQMLEALGARLHMRCLDVNNIKVDMDAVAKLPRAFSERNSMLAVGMDNGMLSVLTNDPTNFYALEDARQTTGMFLDVALCEREPLHRAINYYYDEIDAKRAALRANDGSEELPVPEIIQEDDGDTPVVNLIDSLLHRAYSTGASDIHIEPFADRTLIRMRVDGTLSDFVTIQKSIHASLIARIKILGELDIAEKRIPQDGHFRVPVDNHVLNLRVSVIPTVYGEKAVLRLFAPNANIDHHGSYGMNAENHRLFCEMLKAPNGIIYLTGPTGSGKTTTLYMVLEELSRGNLNISTIEDPVEKNIDRINQMQVNNAAGLTFESGLRALMRQDPDVIMVGETRDSETAAISVRAAITGHIVFSTLHTNDAASSIVRLRDMGVESYLIANSLTGIVAQRLVRKLCPYCSEEYETTDDERLFLGEDVTRARRKKGCSLCNYLGYQGRTAIHEILHIDSKIRRMIADGKDIQEIASYAEREKGMTTLREGGTELVRQGITTVEEVMKVAYYD